ncbi:MAG: polyketide cyclase [Candidatus Rokuibacteriota bacterium]|nr:MAG: polyketide cyclase [Candidatus Rokubacteria bacterium]
MKKDSFPEPLSEREIVTTRVIDAPRERVFKAWTDPEHLAQWWGPKGFTNTFQEFDMRPGGAWRFVMHGPDGVDYKNKSVFVEIVRPERIVFKHVSGPQFQVTATFTEQAGKSRLIFRMLFDTAAESAKVKGFAVEANEQNFDRLEAQLAKMA